MILMYMLCALTVSTVLVALVSTHIPPKREGEVFIGFFIALMALAWAVDEWLFPALAVGQKTVWLPILLLIAFGGVLATSTILSIKTFGSLQQAVADHDNRLISEALVFDLVLWFGLLIAGIVILRSIGS